MRKEEVDSRTLDQRKTLQSSSTGKTANENDEFEKQRTAAIAEIAKSKEVGLDLQYAIIKQRTLLQLYVISVNAYLTSSLAHTQF